MSILSAVNPVNPVNLVNTVNAVNTVNTVKELLPSSGVIDPRAGATLCPGLSHDAPLGQVSPTVVDLTEKSLFGSLASLRDELETEFAKPLLAIACR
ncbi:MAG: hypothetical protein ACKN9S_17185 [Pirellula sp.]